jgi:TetR/AcrR family transcriptional regulator, regulator of cefoperazone and chloramphenicol sensitivity
MFTLYILYLHLMRTPSLPVIPASADPRALQANAPAARRDGQRSREQIIGVALRLFAEQGFANTSTRQISTAAGVNISQISYHFGDKAGLYRAAFTEPMGSPQDDIALFDKPEMTLKEALTGLYTGFIEPLKQSELVRQCVRLHMREMVEPTGLWLHEVDHGIRQHHTALVKVLSKHLGVKQADDEVHRVATAIVAQGVYMYVGRDVMEKITPQLIESPAALDVMRDRLVMYALALVKAEAQRRKKDSLS